MQSRTSPAAPSTKILPLMRRDFPLLTSFRFQGVAPLNCPITGFSARQDDFAYIDEICEWSRHTNSGFELIEVDGDHYIAIITDERDDAPLGRPHIAPGTRIAVPNRKMKWDAGNPTGHGVIFVGLRGQVLCYVAPGGV